MVAAAWAFAFAMISSAERCAMMSRRVEAFELTIVQLVLELGDLGVHAVDLVGDMLEEHIDFVDVVAFAIDREALVVYLSRGDSHL